MKNFDVRIVSKDIINGEPLATCVVTHTNQYFATVRYNYFNNNCESIDIIEAADIQKLFEIKTLPEYDVLIDLMYVEVFDTIAKEITS